MMHSLKRRVFWTALVLTIIVSSLTLLPGRAVSAWSVGTPIVTYWSAPLPLTDAVAQQAVDGGYNVVWIDDVSQLAIAERYGLRAQFHSYALLNPANMNDPTKVAQLDAMIDQFKASPSAYSYIIADEPSVSAFTGDYGLNRLLDHIRQRDPDHLPYINLYPTYAGTAQLGASDYSTYLNQYVSILHPSMLSYDHYNFRTNGDFSDTTSHTNQYLQNLAIISQKARQAGIPFMQIVQACAEIPANRVPNANELRFLNYTTLAYGGQGISYYTYTSWGPNTGGLQPNPDGTPTPVFTALTPLNHEFVAIAEQVQTLRPLGAYVLGDQPTGTTRLPSGSPFTIISPSVPDTTYVEGQPVHGMLLGFFGPDSLLAHARFTLVVNDDYTVAKTHTVIGPGNLSVFDATTGTWSAQRSQLTTLNLLPGGGKLVGLTSAIPFYWTGVGSTTTWSTATGLNNWRLGSGTANDYADSAGVTFDDSANGLIAEISTANVTPGSVVFNNTAKNFAVAGSKGIVGTATVTKQGAGTVTLSSVNTYTGVTTVEAGTLQLNGAAKAQSPVISGGGANIKSGKIVFDYTSESSPATTIQSLLTTSYDGAGPSRFDIGKFKSSTANSTHGLGWLDDGVLKQVTVAYTVYGDTDLDRTVDFTDLNTLLSNYGAGTKWSQGDFDYSGEVNFTDLNTLLSNYGAIAGGTVNGAGLDAQAIQLLSGAGFNVVPEPSSFILLAMSALMGLGMVGRRRLALQAGLISPRSTAGPDLKRDTEVCRRRTGAYAS